ncbi:MAG: tRNA pseudouridine(55) synthase TruB, partial [Thermodesulfobacteriota bacterium]
MSSREIRTDPAGVIVVDKPAGPTSFDVVRRLRSAGRIRKAGHTGTLDPMATGVLPVCLGLATKLAPFLQDGLKEYEGRMMLGLCTDTDDVTGRVVAKRSLHGLEPADVVQTAAEFVGLLEQTPPDYSAVKIDGRPAHRLARAGGMVPARARRIEVLEFNVTAVDLPLVSFRVRVSKGTYIRSLAADL